MSTTSTSLPRIFAAAYAANVPLALVGAPGVGKTSSINAFGKANGFLTKCLVASIREPADFAGYPVPHDGVLNMLPAGFGRDLAAVDQGILFIDELTTAPPAVQAACLRVINDGYIGDLYLGAGIRRWTAYNPPEQAADGTALAPPLANRLCHVHVELSADEWITGMISGWTTAQYTPPPVGWEAGLPVARAMVAGFIKRMPSRLHAMPKDAAAQSGAWPSPRTWDMTTRIVAACAALRMDPDTEATLVGGLVGHGAAMEFLTWRKQQDLPDPEALLRGEPWDVPADGSKAFMTLNSVVACVCAKHDAARWQAAWTVLDRARYRHEDLVVLAARTLAQSLAPKGYRPTPELVKLAPLLRAIGGFGS
jgi:MoxR-like ATPase